MLRRPHVRLARLSDLDRILEIEHASFFKDAYDRNLFAAYWEKCGDLFLVVEHRRRICGYMLTCTGGKDPGRAELVSVAVDPAARGKGLASTLMDSTLRRLRRRRIARFVLMVKETNRTAEAFYEKYGFQRIRLVREYYEDGATGILMQKHLDPV